MQTCYFKSENIVLLQLILTANGLPMADIKGCKMIEFEKKFKTFDDLYYSKLLSSLNEKKID